MSSARRLGAIISSIVGVTLAGGLLVVPVAHSANLPSTSQAAVVAVENSAAFDSEQQAVAGLKQAVAAEQARLNAAAVKKAAVARTAAIRSKAVKIALSRKGMAYSAGSSGPRAFDCSGFTSYVWRTAGKSIERTSWDQYATLKKVSRSAAKPGDLVFFFGSGAHHAAVYLGNNKIIHAANSGTGVVISSIASGWYADRLSGFRRVV